MPESAHPSPAEPPRRPARRRRHRSPLVAGAVIAAAGLVLGGIATASAKGPGHPAPPATSTPKHGDSIPNVTTVEDQIEAYYGDTLSRAYRPGGTDEHVPSPDGNYAHEVEGIAAQAQHTLSGQVHAKHTGTPALVFDVDDTTLNTYNYEIFSQFGYNQDTNAEFVNAEAFPAVFGMPGLENWASSHGYTVFYITGRPEGQRRATVGNLTNEGYTVDSNQLYLKPPTDAPPPSYLTCGSTCTTIPYKSQTRAHIESLGYDIVGNFGDQFSDLTGGHADRTYKIPNPMYFLP